MARFAIDTENAFGVAVPDLRRIARTIGRQHPLALALWETGIHDARLLATMVADPKATSQPMVDAWVCDFRSWDLCDQACTNLFRRTALAHALVARYRDAEGEFVKRTAFAMIAVLAVHDKKAADTVFEAYLPWLEVGADDPRNFVKKAVSWGLRQIGKRNAALNAKAIACAEGLVARSEAPARWVGNDARRELTSDKVQTKLRRSS